MQRDISSVASSSALPMDLGKCSQHLDQIEDLTAKLHSLSSQLVIKEQKIAILKNELMEKEAKLRSYAKSNLDLKREVQVDGKKELF